MRTSCHYEGAVGQRFLGRKLARMRPLSNFGKFASLTSLRILSRKGRGMPFGCSSPLAGEDSEACSQGELA